MNGHSLFYANTVWKGGTFVKQLYDCRIGTLHVRHLPYFPVYLLLRGRLENRQLFGEARGGDGRERREVGAEGERREEGHVVVRWYQRGLRQRGSRGLGNFVVEGLGYLYQFYDGVGGGGVIAPEPRTLSTGRSEGGRYGIIEQGIEIDAAAELEFRIGWAKERNGVT